MPQNSNNNTETSNQVRTKTTEVFLTQTTLLDTSNQLLQLCPNSLVVQMRYQAVPLPRAFPLKTLSATNICYRCKDQIVFPPPRRLELLL
mmetsp:Transcript_61888/g.70094  ORF Transcript_61888/g.70094 Transcript_61888/m.70094 type:complete len:90 (+) Transcript_61888:66-335(+)